MGLELELVLRQVLVLGTCFSSFANQNCLTAEHFGGARIGARIETSACFGDVFF